MIFKHFVAVARIYVSDSINNVQWQYSIVKSGI